MNNVKLIAGNWKMNGSLANAKELLGELTSNLEGKNPSFEMVVCPPSILIPEALSLTADSIIKVGGQDCHKEEKGAFTSNTSAPMLKDAGCEYVIIGHSERRQFEKDTDELVAEKAKAAHAAGLKAIICVGELEDQREAGTQNDIVCAQLSKAIPSTATAENTVIAYEPVWAIGTGKVASVEDVKNMHEVIRNKIKDQINDSDKVSLLYGGSVKPANAAEIMGTANVDGVLVGGAALKAQDFFDIAKAGCSNSACSAAA